AGGCRGGKTKSSTADSSMALPIIIGNSLGPTGINVEGSGTWNAKSSTSKATTAIANANRRSIVRYLDMRGQGLGVRGQVIGGGCWVLGVRALDRARFLIPDP
ncbi:MAG TPA: hypothetical protein VEX13_09190, partial [Chloroflexia bacterium]|nr:hypothetical protein [Chloroflexia bacterium]